jgi:hypothetical protein
VDAEGGRGGKSADVVIKTVDLRRDEKGWLPGGDKRLR